MESLLQSPQSWRSAGQPGAGSRPRSSWSQRWSRPAELDAGGRVPIPPGQNRPGCASARMDEVKIRDAEAGTVAVGQQEIGGELVKVTVLDLGDAGA